MSIALWIVQILLALLFLWTGAVKLIMPIAEMTKEMPSMPGWFLRFIAVCEVLGGLGLVLPSWLRIKPGLTPLAASLLVIIMIGAAATGFALGQIVGIVVPIVVAILLIFVAYGRTKVAPIRGR